MLYTIHINYRHDHHDDKSYSHLVCSLIVNDSLTAKLTKYYCCRWMVFSALIHTSQQLAHFPPYCETLETNYWMVWFR